MLKDLSSTLQIKCVKLDFKGELQSSLNDDKLQVVTVMWKMYMYMFCVMHHLHVIKVGVVVSLLLKSLSVTRHYYKSDKIYMCTCVNLPNNDKVKYIIAN